MLASITVKLACRLCPMGCTSGQVVTTAWLMGGMAFETERNGYHSAVWPKGTWINRTHGDNRGGCIFADCRLACAPG